MIAIIDYDAGNIRSVEKALQLLKQPYVLTRDAQQIMEADRIILPGVGAFEEAMFRIRGYGLEEVIQAAVKQGIPFLGICLGMQLLFEQSEEGSGTAGLGLLRGNILKIPEQDGLKVPHMGWNSLHGLSEQSRLFAGISEGTYVYFVHSYYLKAKEQEVVAATAEYGVSIHAAVEAGNIFGCQFHPEKSSAPGLRILHNFTKISREDVACLPKE